MQSRAYLVTMASSAALGWVTWVLVIFYINPFTATRFEKFLFYLTLFFAFLGTFFLIGWFLRARLLKRFRLSEHLGAIWRQSALLTLLLLILLFFASEEALRWWVAVLPFLAFFLLELFFVTYERPQ